LQGSAPRCRRQASASPSSIKTTTREEFIAGHSWFDLIGKSGGGISKEDFANFLDGAH
jgi:hypothetical protein